MDYNTLIHPHSGKSFPKLCRILITDLNQIPKKWIVTYCFNPINRLTADIQHFCCGPTNPLHLYPPRLQETFPIFVRDVLGNFTEVHVSRQDTVRTLKWKICENWDSNFPLYQKLYISRDYNQVKLLDSVTIDQYGISKGHSIFLKTKTPKEPKGYQAIDMEATYPRIISQLKPWTRYSAGLNLCGACPNQSCISKKTQPEVVIPMGYGTTRLTLSDSQFTCPACKTSLIFPDKFLVSSAMRAGERTVKTKLIESTGHGDEFQEVYFGFPFLIEITTVEPWRSPYTYVKCNQQILFKDREYIMSCGHVYHNKLCKPNAWKQCKICKAKLVGTLMIML